MNDSIGKLTPEGLDLVAFGPVRLTRLVCLFPLRAATEVSLLVVVGFHIGVGLYELDVVGGLGGWVCGPVVWDDGDLVLDIRCSGWASGRGTSVQEVLVRVWLG